MNSWGNGGFHSVPGGINNIWSPSVPNGTYGTMIPAVGSLGNANTTPQISGVTIIKGDGYVRYENKETGQFSVCSENGVWSSGWK